MAATPLHVVTGALGYTGRSITEQLLAQGARVRTLTNSPNRPNPFGDKLEIHPLALDSADTLARSLEGADVLYNTYWVRFNHALFTFDRAVAGTKALFDAARRAGVKRIVHVSILHARAADDLGYYRGKHELEAALEQSGVPHAIIRPGVLFGRGDILVNNIAWVLRHLPVFGLFGDGRYRLRPLHVDDMARLCIDHAHRAGYTHADAVGPEGFEFRGLVRAIAAIIGVKRPTFPVPPGLGYLVGRCVNPFVRDVIITREEIEGLMRGLLDSDAPAAGHTNLTEWAAQHRDTLGRRYASEVGRRVHRAAAYEAI
ncbi:MAG: NAD(P)H-binding protein [Phycisphaerales bacterium]|nr:NAD(P)H-binding protein [Phycisphaerales bacterium]